MPSEDTRLKSYKNKGRDLDVCTFNNWNLSQFYPDCYTIAYLIIHLALLKSFTGVLLVQFFFLPNLLCISNLFTSRIWQYLKQLRQSMWKWYSWHGHTEQAQTSLHTQAMQSSQLDIWLHMLTNLSFSVNIIYFMTWLSWLSMAVLQIQSSVYF